MSLECLELVRISHSFVLAGLALLAACASQPIDPAPPVAPDLPQPPPVTSEPVLEPPVAVHQAVISAAALTPYSQDHAPELIIRFSSRLDEVEAFRQVAASAAAVNPDCQVISMVEVASTSTIDSLRFWVECSDINGDSVRYNFTEDELSRLP